MPLPTRLTNYTISYIFAVYIKVANSFLQFSIDFTSFMIFFLPFFGDICNIIICNLYLPLVGVLNQQRMLEFTENVQQRHQIENAILLVVLKTDHCLVAKNIIKQYTLYHVYNVQDLVLTNYNFQLDVVSPDPCIARNFEILYIFFTVFRTVAKVYQTRRWIHIPHIQCKLQICKFWKTLFPRSIGL